MLKVGSKSNPNSVAGALANVFREKSEVEVQAIVRHQIVMIMEVV